MSNPFLPFIIALGITPNYDFLNLDDIDYVDNEPVQDLLFDFYLGMLQLDTMDPEPENYEERIEIFANNIKQRLTLLKQDEQAYVTKQIKEVLHLDEIQDEEKTLKKRKEND